MNTKLITYLSAIVACSTVTLFSCSNNTGNHEEKSSADTLEVLSSNNLPFLIGTYTGGEGGSEGIYKGTIHTSTGELTLDGLAAPAKNPSYLAVSKDSKFVYAANELPNAEGDNAGRISAYSLDANTGNLTLLNDIPSNGGSPCYVSLDATEQFILAANYGSGNISMVARNEQGGLQEELQIIKHEGSSITDRQKVAHAHYIRQNPYSDYIYSADLGIDKVLIYKIEEGKILPNDPPSQALTPGAGPRHVDFHPNGKYVYVISELNSTISVFEVSKENGAMNSIQTISTLPEGYSEQSYCADIHIHPNGKFLYGSNRGHDSIAIFTINESTGEISLRGFADQDIDWPRNFALTPDGSFLIAANQKSNSIVSFTIDQHTGDLTPTGSKIAVGAPVCIAFY
ncbi:MAG: lactonase family protein [Cyclobacteriaceae bacterium]|nr:lactonase family protein [Cyclobacteriaceae bacterium]